jgi:hypothetical protein
MIRVAQWSGADMWRIPTEAAASSSGSGENTGFYSLEARYIL